MSMTRDELNQRIAAGAEYLQRQDITPEQLSAAREKVNKYRSMLREMDEPSKLSAEEKAAKVQTHIDAIRQILSKNRTEGMSR